MRKAVIAFLVGAVWTTFALCDVVYMRNGKTYEGVAERHGDKVRIQLPYGTVEVPAKDVVTIVKGKVATKPTSKPEVKDTPGALGSGGIKTAVPLDKTSQPEVVAFMMMRRLSAGSSSHAASLKRQLEQYRILAHEKKRRIGGRWLGPKDFIRHRKAFEKYAAEAKELEKKSSRLKTPKDAKRDKDRVRNLMLVTARRRMAAKAWADPVLRNFLLGAVELEADLDGRAEKLFRNCCREEPRVGAFHQGRGMALLKLHRELEAVEEFTIAMTLCSDSKCLVTQLREAMSKAPGAKVKSKAYKAAEKLLDSHGGVGKAPSGVGRRRTLSTRFNWELPGLKTSSRNKALPSIPYDRLYFKQALGVPVSEHVLMVDTSVLDGALEVFVRIDENTVVPAKTRRRVSPRVRTKQPPPLTAITIEGYSFKPVTIDAELQLKKTQKVSIYGLGVFEEMGSIPRTATVRVTDLTKDGAAVLSSGLAAGEATSCVLTDDGKLLGFLAGRTNVKADGGGPYRWINLSEIKTQLKQAMRKRHRSRSDKKDKAAETRPAAGKVFIVYATFAESFKK